MKSQQVETRYIVWDEGDTFSLVFPAPSGLVGILISLLFSLVLPVSIVYVGSSLLRGAWLSSQVGLALFAAVVLFAAALVAVLWMLVSALARQAVVFGPEELYLRHAMVLGGRVINLWRDHRCSLAQVRNLRLYPDLGRRGIGGAPFAIDFRDRTIWFGLGLNEAEVREVWRLLQRRFPALAVKD